mgnify:CR=1 FL=1
MRKAVPAVALGLGLASYCFLLLVSREATIGSLMMLGMMSLAIISLSLWILWSTKIETVQEPAPQSQTQNPAQKPETEMYLEITE